MATKLKMAVAPVKGGGGVSVAARNTETKSAVSTAAKVDKAATGKGSADWKYVTKIS